MLDAEHVLTLAEQVVAEQGEDFVYSPNARTDCFNVPLSELRTLNTQGFSSDDEPDPSDPREITGCLVGRILDLAGEERHHQWEYVADSISNLNDRFSGDIATERACTMLFDMQTSQDDGNSWGTALRKMKQKMEEGKYLGLPDVAVEE